MTLVEILKHWAQRLKRESFALWIAARDARTPLMAKLVAGAVAAYAFSPVDLIPDFIPVLGYLDDLLVVPLGISFALRLIPGELMAEFRKEAAIQSKRPQSTRAAVIVVAIWASGALVLLLPFLSGQG